jgi:hypothetical protein
MSAVLLENRRMLAGRESLLLGAADKFAAFDH